MLDGNPPFPAPAYSPPQRRVNTHPAAGGEAGLGGATRDNAGHARGGTTEAGGRGLGSSSPLAGTAMTLEGPVPYTGNILDNPDVVWMDDRWTKDEA